MKKYILILDWNKSVNEDEVMLNNCPRIGERIKTDREYIVTGVLHEMDQISTTLFVKVIN